MLNYEIFLRFFANYKAQEFQHIDPNSPLVTELNEKLSTTGQVFHISDLTSLKIIYLCDRCHKFFGVGKHEMDPSVYLGLTHPDDRERFATARSKVFRMASKMSEEGIKNMVVSSFFKTKIQSGNYIVLLYQLYLINSELPSKKVYCIQVNTDLTDLLKNHRGYHYYVGTDPSFFRYPDIKLLNTGNIFSQREFEIIKEIAQGLDSNEIANKLFLSVHTVNTHRRKILLKTGKRSTHELVIELQEQGLI